MHTTMSQKTVAFLMITLLFTVPARANHFIAQRIRVEDQERAIVTSHGMDLFTVGDAREGTLPVRRAQVVANRLEAIANTNTFVPDSFRVESRNGTVLLQQDGTDGVPQLLVKVAPVLAPGTATYRLAQWWLALLRDHLALATGHRPQYTAGTRVGTVFQKLYLQLGAPTDSVSSDAIDSAFQNLSVEDQQTFRSASTKVPVVYATDQEYHRYVGQADTGPALPVERYDRHTVGTDPFQNPTVEQGSYPRDGNSLRWSQAQQTRNDLYSEKVQVHGVYRVQLLTDPRAFVRGRTTNLLVRLISTTPTDYPSAGATLRGWFFPEGEKPSTSVPGVYDRDADTYRFRISVPSAGDISLLQIGVMTESGDAFKVRFPISLVGATDDIPTTERMDSARIRHVGSYSVALSLYPKHPQPGEDTEIDVRVGNTDTGTPVEKAFLHVWLLSEGQQAADVKPFYLNPTEDPGIYSYNMRGRDAGTYRLLVKVQTSTGYVFRALFSLRVSRPDTLSTNS